MSAAFPPRPSSVPGAPLHVAEATRAGVPAERHQHRCAHTLHQLFAAADAPRNRYAGFFGQGYDCFAF
jgi:hypothetical protein